MRAERAASVMERWAWAAGLLFVVALLLEAGVSAVIPINQDDSATKIATELAAHRQRVLFVAYCSTVYAPMFVIWLWKLHELLSNDARRPRLGTLVLAGGVLFVSLHAVSDIGIMGMLGAKVAPVAAREDQTLSYTLYLLTFALDSVGDVFGSLFAVAAGMLIFQRGVLPRWLGWTAVAFGAFFFVQGFGLGGVISTFGLVTDLIGWLLFLVFVTASSAIMLARREPAAEPGATRAAPVAGPV
ncbi:MAG TPA: hypothetical protein VFY79_09775 [Dehalococcoidia bacterium]|nr:hypothetical protein [Dehalococcoidia bacterium]